MLNKLKFNNLVISNKKGIEQSRKQTINKLVRKIRKLKTLLEKHDDNIKTKERIRKSTETMETLKKIKRIDIMKNVLIMDKPGAAIITNGIASPEEVAVALLSMNRVMQGLTKRFKTELLLAETENDNWKQVLKESSKRRQKIERTEEKRKKRLQSKQLKAMGRKRQEWLEQNQLDINSNNFQDNVKISSTGCWHIEELSNDKIIVTDKKIVNKPNNALKLHNNNNKRDELKCTETKSIELKRQIDCSDTIKEIRKVFNSNEISSKTEDATAETLVIDPFFITDTGENYLSAATKVKDLCAENEGNKEKQHVIKPSNVKHYNHIHRSLDKKQQDFWKERQQSSNIWNKGRDQNNNSDIKHTNKINRPQNKWNNKNNHLRQDTSDEKKLHPSWAAKQKHKPIITAFQGKKITFEVNDMNEASKDQEKLMKTLKSPKLTLNNELDSLHPSWSAKKKLKPSILEYQGKKITFDNVE